MRNQQSRQTSQLLISEGSAGTSRSRCTAETQAQPVNGWFWPSLLFLFLALLGLLLTSSSELYEAFRSLPVLDQFAAVAASSLFALGFAATVREFRTDFMERWAARIVGACGIAFLLAFAFRMTLTVERLQHQLVAQTKAKSVSEQHGAAVYTVTLKNGSSVTWNPTNERLHRPVSYMARPSEPWRSDDRAGHGFNRRQYAPTDSMPAGQSWQWAAASAEPSDGSAATAGDAPDF